jgi:transposase
VTDTFAKSIIIGVDTHKATNVAVVIDTNGARLAEFSAPATSKGYLVLECWARALERFPTCLNRRGIPSGRDF